MAMARCTLSVCFRSLSSALAAFGLISIQMSAQADVSWKAGVFPIAVFEGYTSHYGLRRGGDGELRPHTGLDIAAPLGSPVLSWWAGHVVDTIHDASCGIGVVVASGGYEHIYCHLQQQRMRSGQAVQAGQVIGQVGMTGRTSGPHLHWGIQFEGRWLDPALILKAMIRSRRASGAPGP